MFALRKQRPTIETGFTLIELIMVIAIIGILASLVVSVYQTYTVRAQVAEALDMATHTKAPIVDAFISSGRPPADRAEAGITPAATGSSGRYVSQVNVVNGRIDIVMGNQVHADVFGDVVSFTPYLLATGGVVWRCGAAPAPGGGAVLLSDGGPNSATYLPPTLDTRYLPAPCRN